MPSASHITIDKVTIAGFRGYNSPKTIDLNGKSALFLGPNMSGKSSTLGAIEWCLFDDFYSLPADRTRVGDELVNDHSPSASVKLELARGGKRFVVERVKQRGESKSKLKITADDGTVVQGPEASNRVFQILGLGFEDFVRSVYLHQENTRDILTEDKKVRSEAMDRLFGLENLRNISDGLKPSTVKDVLSSLTKERDSVAELIAAKVSEAKRSLDEAIGTGSTLGLPKRSLTLSHAKEVLSKAMATLKDASDRTSIPIPAGVPISEYSDIKAASSSINAAVATIRKHVPEDRRLKEINRSIADIESARGEYTKEQTTLSEAEKQLKAFVQKNGNPKDLERRIRTLEAEAQRLEQGKDQMDAKGKLIQAGITYLGQVTRLTKCPMCDSPLNQADLAEHLQKEARTAVSKELKNIGTSIKKAERDREKTATALEELLKLESKVKDANERVGERIAEIAKLLKKTLSAESVEAESKKELSRLRSQKDKLDAPIEERETRLTEVVNALEQAKAIAEVLKRQSRLDELSEVHERKELKNVEAVIRELANLQTSVELLGDTTRDLQTELAQSLVARSMPAIKRFYAELAGHPYYDSVEIEVQPESRGGVVKNLYVIKGISEKERGESMASLKFSTGHMNCVGLSVFLALAHEGAYTHNVGFLILDDPSQNLDDKHKEALANVLAKMQVKSQVIIASEDESFQSQLSSSLEAEDLMRVEFGAWDVDGPKIKVTK